MEFGVGKCAVLIMEKEKKETKEGIELLNLQSIRTLEEKENYQNLGIFEANHIKQTVMKEKVRIVYLRVTRKLQKLKNQAL